MPWISGRFFQLDELLLAPPFSAIAAVLIALGAFRFGRVLACGLRGAACDALDVAAGYIAVVAGMAVFAHAALWVGVAVLPVLRVTGWVFAVVGLFELRSGPRVLRDLRSAFFEASGVGERAGLVIAAAIAVLLGLSALGPPTDADSCAYHLAAPLDWLRHGSFYVRPDWLLARLCGLGECVNALGLAAGTDILGAVLQWSGLIVAGLAASAFATRGRRALPLLLAFAPPLMNALVPSQKPQMFPSAAVVLALVMVLRRRNELDRATLFFAAVLIAFAAGCKASFLISGFAACLGIGVVAWKARRMLPAFAFVAGAMVLIVGPVLARNFIFYNDPLPPFFEAWKHEPDALLLAFGKYIRELSGPLNLTNLLMLPVRLAVTVQPGKISELLGIGILAVVLALRDRQRPVGLLPVAAVSAVLTVVLGQFSGRFLLEPYLWCAAAAGASEEGKFKTVLRSAMTAQGVLVAGMAFFGAVLLFPGAWTKAQRDTVLSRCAPGYLEATWIESIVPADAVVLFAPRTYVFVPRRFVAWDFWLEDLPDEEKDRRVVALIASSGTTLVVRYQREDALAEWAKGKPRGPSEQFQLATRNPFNREKSYGLEAVPVNGK